MKNLLTLKSENSYNYVCLLSDKDLFTQELKELKCKYKDLLKKRKELYKKLKDSSFGYEPLVEEILNVFQKTNIIKLRIESKKLEIQKTNQAINNGFKQRKIILKIEKQKTKKRLIL